MNLTHATEQVVRKYLIDKAVAVEPSYDAETSVYNGSAWPGFYAVEPDAPDEVITVYGTEPKLDARIQVDGVYAERPGIQIRVRGRTRSSARARADLITEKLEKYSETYLETVTIGASSYLIQSFKRESGPFAIGQATPQSKLQVVTVNYTLIIKAI